MELFSTLTHEELKQITRSTPIRSFKKTEVIPCEADTNEFVCIILEGEVKVVRTAEEEKAIILATHRAGEFFGRERLLPSQSRSSCLR
jgi:CRP-like cAMP-binding protein